ncbi:MAG: translation initiation factor eIF-1A [Candidatus Asgardarchaeia archaeon]
MSEDEEDINKVFEALGESQRRIRMPEEGEMFGIVIQMLGHDRAKVKCADGKIRVCRIPGKMKKRIWIREGDVVLVAPWDFQDDRADIVWRYNKNEARWLEENGYLQVEEF